MYNEINKRETERKTAGRLIVSGVGFLLFLLVMAAITHQEKEVRNKPGVYCTGYSIIPNNKTHVVNCHGDTVKYTYNRLKPAR